MSKYDLLWDYIKKSGEQNSMLTFAEIKHILGFDIDHSFLNFKKELNDYGYEIKKISIKEKTIKYGKLE